VMIHRASPMLPMFSMQRFEHWAPECRQVMQLHAITAQQMHTRRSRLPHFQSDPTSRPADPVAGRRTAGDQVRLPALTDS
jgi:hypothetical protein